MVILIIEAEDGFALTQDQLSRERFSYFEYSYKLMIIIILILSSIGILDAGFLTYVHIFGGQVCGQSAGCSYVLASSYSKIVGVPVSTIGLGAYFCLTFLALKARDAKNKADAVRWIFYISITGALMSGYFIFLQALVLKHWCPFCILSATLMISIFALNLWYCRSKKGISPLLRFPKWSLGPKTMLVLLILPTLISFGIEQVISFASTKSLLSDNTKVAARMGERIVTVGEVDHGIRSNINQIEWYRYAYRLLWLENELLSMEAKAQGVSAKELTKENVDNAVNVSEVEIKAAYESKRDEFGKTSYKKARKQLSKQIKLEKKKSLRQEYLTKLKQIHNVSFSIPKPLSLTLESNPRNGPVLGPDEADLTVIIFTDFECPFCIKVYPKVKSLQERYPQDIRIVFRHFPLAIHKKAHNAAYAAACAHLQGKFWPYADLLFKSKGKLESSKLFEYAKQIGLDMEVFKQCMDSGRGKEIVDADIAEGIDLNINATPALYFNGHFSIGFPNSRLLQIILEQNLPNLAEPEPKS